MILLNAIEYVFNSVQFIKKTHSLKQYYFLVLWAFLLSKPFSLVAQTVLPFSSYYGGVDVGDPGLLYHGLDDTGIYYVSSVNEAGFQTTPGAYQSNYGGNGNDLIILKIDHSGRVVWSTYLGGSVTDYNNTNHDFKDYSFLVEGDALYIAGSTNSGTLTGFSTYGPGGFADYFVAKFNALTGNFEWGSMLGGTDNDLLSDIYVHGDAVYVGGQARTGAPVTSDALESTGNNNPYFAILNSSTGALEYASYLQTSSANWINQLVVFGNTLALTGVTANNLAVTNDAFIKNSTSTWNNHFLIYFDLITRKITYATYMNYDTPSNDNDAYGVLDLKTDGTRIYALQYGDGTPYLTSGEVFTGQTNNKPWAQVWEGTNLIHSANFGIGDVDYPQMKVDTVNGRWYVYGEADRQTAASVDPLPGDIGNDDDNAWIMEREIGTNTIVFRTTLDDGSNAEITDVFPDAAGNLYILGTEMNDTLSDNGLITTDAFASSSADGDNFLLILDANRDVIYGTYLWDAGVEARDIYLNILSSGVVEIFGLADDNSLPLTDDATAFFSGTVDNFFYTQLDYCPDLTANTIDAAQTVCINGLAQVITGSDVNVNATYSNLNTNGVVSSQNGQVAYQWQSSVDNMSWVNIPGATERDFLPAPTAVNVFFRRLAGGNNGICSPDTSNIHTVTVNTLQAPTLTEGESYICPNTNITIGLPASGGTNTTYTYSWSPSVNLDFDNIAQPTFNGTEGAVYVVTVTDDGNNCQFAENWQVNVFSANAGADLTFCAGQQVGGVVGSSPPSLGNGFTFNWISVSGDPVGTLSNTSIAQPTAEPTVTTVYELEVTIDAVGCTTTDQVQVGISSPLADAGRDTVLCLGENVVLGGEATQAGFTYGWAPGIYINNQNIAQPTMQSSLCPPDDGITGTDNPLIYTLTKIDDASGCKDVDTVEVSILLIDLFTPFICPPVTIGYRKEECGLSLPGVTFTWSVVSGDFASLAPGDVNLEYPTVNPSSSTVYQLDVCLNGKCCSDQVTVNPTCVGGCTLDIEAYSSISCPVGGQYGTEIYAVGGVDGYDIVNLPPNYSYEWTPTTGLVNPDSLRTAVNTLATDQEYVFNILGADGTTVLCTDTITVYASIASSPLIGIDENEPTCSGEPVGIGLPSVAGWSYAWSPSTGLNFDNIAEPEAMVTENTTYIVTATDIVTGCTHSDTVNVILRNPIINAGDDKSFCDNAIVTLGSPAVPNQTYSWTPLLGLSEPNAAQPKDTLFAGVTYTLEVTDTETGCTATDMVTFTLVSAPTYDAPDVNVCEGGSVQIGLVAQAGYSYFWSPSTGLSDPYAAQPIATVNSSTTYTVVVSDNATAGCYASDQVKVNVVASTFSLNLTDQQDCQGATVNIGVADQGGTYSWTPSIGLSDASNFNPLYTIGDSTATYILEWVTPDGCTLWDKVSISPYDEITLSFLTNYDICTEASVQIGSSAAESGGTYAWTSISGDPIGTLSDPNIHNPIATPTVTTTYRLTYTSSNGCVQTRDVTINVSPPPTVNLGPDQTVCPNITLTPTTTGTISSYIWSTSETTNSITVSPLASTEYRVTVTESNGCTGVDTIIVNPTYAIDVGIDRTICPESTTTIGTPDASGGALTYAWSISSGPGPLPGLTNTPEIDVTPTGTTIYLLTIDDGMGCMLTDEITVTVSSSIGIDLGSDQVACIGGCVTIGVPATTGYTYQWNPTTDISDPTQSIVTLCPSSAISYELFATNTSTGCVFSDEINLTIGASNAPMANAGADVALCPGETVQLGSAVVEGLNYSWTPTTGLSDPSIANPALTLSSSGPPPYIVKVLAPLTNCMSLDTVDVTVNPAPTISITAPPTLCSGGSYTLTTNVTSTEEDNEIYSWTPAQYFVDPTIEDAIITEITGPVAQVLTLTVTDATTGCSNVGAITVNVDGENVVADAGVDQTVCINDVVTLGGSGTTTGAGITYDWRRRSLTSTSFSASTFWYTDATRTNATALPKTPSSGFSGVYRLRITGNSGCQAMDEVTLLVEPAPTIEAGTDVILCGVASYTMTASTTGTGTGTWTQVSGPNTAVINDINDPLTEVSSLTTGTYVFQWTVNGTCHDGNDLVTLGVVEPPMLVLANLLCESDLTSTSLTSGSFLGDANLSYWLDTNTSIQIPDPTSVDVGTYFILAFNSTTGCEATASIASFDCDWGDLPDTSSITNLSDYQTLSSNNGPRHVIISGLSLGTTIDNESNGQPSTDALGDGMDEDGVLLYASLDVYPNMTFRLPFSYVNTTGDTAHVEAWIDWNGDGAFDGVGEMVADWSDEVTSFPNRLEVTVPSNVMVGGLLGLRIRISNQDNMTPYGLQPNGEIEDYLLGIACPQVCIPIQATVIRQE